jgi:hypothetical protein
MPDYLRYLPAVDGRIDTHVHDLALATFTRREFPEAWARLMLHIIPRSHTGSVALDPISWLVLATAGDIDGVTQRQIIRALLLHVLTDSLRQRGRYFNWPYPQMEEMRQGLAAGLMALVEADMVTATSHLFAFVNQYREKSRVAEGPFVGCLPCHVRCWLRHDAVVVANDSAFRREIVEAINRHGESAPLWSDLATISREATIRLAGPLPPPDTSAVAICIMAQATHLLGFRQNTQRMIAETLATIV